MYFYFVHSNKSFVSLSDEHSFFKKFTETNLRKCISFMLVKDVLGQDANKNVFFKFKRSVFRAFFLFFFTFLKLCYKIGDYNSNKVT